MENKSASEDIEYYVEGLDGTTPREVFSLTFFVPMCSFLIWLVAGLVQISPKSIKCIEVAVLNIVLLLALTVLENHLFLVIVSLGLLILIVLYIVLQQPSTDQHMAYVMKNKGMEMTPKRDINAEFIGGYRGHLLLATSISILAVDFNFYPSRFAKNDTYGWSVMDAGVGSFVLLHGLCSSHGKYFSTKQHRFKKGFLSSFPLFFLGLIRFIAISAVGYHKVVPEYGIHWNFFFTLAFTKMICHSVLCTLNIKPGLMGIATVAIHQLLLSEAGLSSLVLSDVRNSFFEANKEGICSLLGFISLYFCGVQIGRMVWKQGCNTKDYVHLLLKLCGIGIVGWTIMYFFHGSVQPISRRMANLPYCIWVVALTSLQLAVHLGQTLITIVLSKILKNNYSDFILWKAINYNGLFYFLLSNLLTGLVNLTINTDKASDLMSSVILVLYLTILSISSVLMYEYSFQLKFW